MANSTPHPLSALSTLMSLPIWKNKVAFTAANSLHPAFAAFGSIEEFLLESGSALSLDAFQQWLNHQNQKVFGVISYEIKNKVENVKTTAPSIQSTPDLAFFSPQLLLVLENSHWKIVSNNSPLNNVQVEEYIVLHSENSEQSLPLTLQPHISPEQYIADVQKMKKHIQHGDIYEVNYCQAFLGKGKISAPFQLFKKLYHLTEAPHAGYFEWNNHVLCCGSPERFMAMKNQQLISQPIKGTIRRGKSESEDLMQRQTLLNSAKERSENVMITDLVRNDISKVAEKGSVKVTELFGVHAFKTVHHLISTVEGRVKTEHTFGDIIKALFPMGSMTGAPKVRALELIDETEHTARGWYSGSLGWIDHTGDFDFNVIIRSIQYNHSTEQISYHVGSAITSLCHPEDEYDECLLKAEAMATSLGASIHADLLSTSR